MTRFILRLLIVPIGIGFAAVAALVAGIVGMLTWGYEAGLATIAAATGLSVLQAAWGGADPGEIAAFIAALWLLLLGIVLAPITLTALAGELFRIGSWMFYAFVTGGAFVLVPALFRGDPATHDWPANATLGFFATGIIAGTVYWLIAGRGAAPRRTPVASPAPVDRPGSLHLPPQPGGGEADAGLHRTEG